MSTHFVNLLSDLRRRSVAMARLVEDMVAEACEAVFLPDEALARRVIRRDEEVDREEIAVEAEVIRLMALYQPVGIDIRTLCTVLKVNNDLERIADCAVNVAERAKHGQVQAVAAASERLREMCPVVRRMLHEAIEAYGRDDEAAGGGVLDGEVVVDGLYAQIVRGIVDGAVASADAMAARLDLLSVAKNLERIADHATNIMEDVVYLRTGRIVRHGSRHGE